MRELAAEQRGLGAVVCEHLATGGKRLRARLCLDMVAALGGHVEGALGWAAACELLHNATLIPAVFAETE